VIYKKLIEKKSSKRERSELFVYGVFCVFAFPVYYKDDAQDKPDDSYYIEEYQKLGPWVDAAQQAFKLDHITANGAAVPFTLFDILYLKCSSEFHQESSMIYI
jgi:hypothetical protein